MTGSTVIWEWRTSWLGIILPDGFSLAIHIPQQMDYPQHHRLKSSGVSLTQRLEGELGVAAELFSTAITLAPFRITTLAVHLETTNL
jgi:hypothetical protein